MQTFLPYSDFRKSAECLDYRRLGKQRLEANDILCLVYKIMGKDKKEELELSERQMTYLWRRFRHHPAVLMWVGYIGALKSYRNTIIEEWIERGYRNNIRILPVRKKIKKPFWLGNRKFHSSHRSNLLRKNLEFYSKYDWEEKNNLPYLWPVRKK